MAWRDFRSTFFFNNFRALFRSQGILSEGQNASPVNGDWFSHLYFPLIKYGDDQSRMMEAQLRTHTVRSHGVTLARVHKHDWLILMLLVAIEVILNAIHPFYRFVGKDMMTYLKYPQKDNTVPFWAVPVYTILLPIVVFLFFYLRRRDVYDLHHSILGLLFSLAVTGVITDAIKDSVGRPRPDFFWRCFPDGKDVYDQWGNVVCHGDKNILKEGHKSFPSGHTSWSFAGLGFLSLYLSGKLRAFDSRGHIRKLCIVFLPLLAASLVGISRVDDYKHHWQDVVAGGLIGLVVATFCYLQFFPTPYHDDGWGSYTYFRVLEEIHAGIQPASVVEMSNAENSDAQVGNHQNERRKNACMGMSLSFDSAAAVGDIESGRR